MAQTRLISIVAKHEKMDTSVKEMINCLTSLSKVITLMRLRQFGRRMDLAQNHIPADNILALLQSCHHIDTLILNLQNLLSQCSAYSTFIQRQLELRSCRH